MPAAGDVPRGDRAGDDPAVDAEAGVRRQDDLEQVVLVQLPLVDDVVQPAADQRGDGDDDDPVVDEPGVEAPPARLARDHEVGERDPDGVADAVPVDRDGSEVEGDGIGRDRDQREDGRIAARGHVKGMARSVQPGRGCAAGSAILGRDARHPLPRRTAADGAEFNWWLLIVGVVAGAALTWLVVADSTRREREVGERELPAEAAWIARSVDQPGVDAEAAEAILRAHRRYLGFPPPDVLVDPDQLEAMIQDRWREHRRPGRDPRGPGKSGRSGRDRPGARDDRRRAGAQLAQRAGANRSLIGTRSLQRFPGSTLLAQRSIRRPGPRMARA